MNYLKMSVVLFGTGLLLGSLSYTDKTVSAQASYWNKSVSYTHLTLPTSDLV